MNHKIAFSGVTIILAVSLIANANLMIQQSSFNTNHDAQQKKAAELSGKISNLQNENTKLQSQLNQLDQNGIKLVTRLGASDLWNNGELKDKRVYFLYGEVWNVGTSAAQNCTLHVILYIGVAVIKDTTVELGKIDAGSYALVSSKIDYPSRTALTNWTIIPEHN